ncbi:MAG: hypothetical protein JO053_15615, partial [Acidobacteria bacterium]|nr:hypothetical protein [Acidobacteriota bacterium]
RSSVLGLKYDPAKVAVRSVSYGDAFGAAAKTPITPFLNQMGKTYFSMTAKEGSSPGAAGILAFVEIEALAAGRPELALDKDVLSFLTADGKNFAIKIRE